ncbi:hypothetical protein BDR03DRAFT_939543 [Suillus americanus]|nr:hypothetical protein BDR03DRAFT_939543 [Suillus americanus]
MGLSRCMCSLMGRNPCSSLRYGEQGSWCPGRGAADRGECEGWIIGGSGFTIVTVTIILMWCNVGGTQTGSRLSPSCQDYTGSFEMNCLPGIRSTWSEGVDSVRLVAHN